MSNISHSHLLGDNMFYITTGQYTVSGIGNTNVYVTASVIPNNLGRYKVLEIREYTYSRTGTGINISIGHIPVGSPAINYVDILPSSTIAGNGGLRNYYLDIESFNASNNQALPPGEEIIIQHRFSATVTASLRVEMFGIYFGEHQNWVGG